MCYEKKILVPWAFYKSTTNYFSVFSLILPVLFWGLSFISTKVVLNEMPPVTIAFMRQVIALIPLFIIIIATRMSLRIKLRDLLLLAVHASLA